MGVKRWRMLVFISVRFESSVILYGCKAPQISTPEMPAFESSVILYGYKAKNCKVCTYGDV